MKDFTPLRMELEDNQWPFTWTDHHRRIARAIVTDGAGQFYFVRAVRNDEFGPATIIETSGGGIEAGEDPETAVLRELREELGVEAEVLCALGEVSDYYNLIHRHNLNRYFLCRITAFGEKHLTDDEANSFHLTTLRLTGAEALAAYAAAACTPLGRLLAAREVPVLRLALEILEDPAAKPFPSPGGGSAGRP